MSVVNGARSLDVHYQNLTVWANYGVLRCLAELATGLVAYRLYRAVVGRLEPSRATATAAEVVLLAGACALLFRPTWTSPYDVLVIPIFAALVFVLATGRGFVARALLLPPLRWVGKLSYSIYINHFLVVMSLSLIITTQWWLYSFFMQGWPYFGLVLGLSWLTYTYIENPARRALNARLARIVS
jgi:peptidoglycan/LPS O-acetylase OafA/YrhL